MKVKQHDNGNWTAVTNDGSVCGEGSTMIEAIIEAGEIAADHHRSINEIEER